MRAAASRSTLALVFALFVAATAALLPAPAHADSTGLVGYWSFDDGTGTQATDFSGSHNPVNTQSSPPSTKAKMFELACSR